MPPHPARESVTRATAASRVTLTSLLSATAGARPPRARARPPRDRLRPAAPPADHAHRALRDLQCRRKQLDERLVRPPALGRSRHACLPTAAVPPDQLGPRRAGRDNDADSDPCGPAPRTVILTTGRHEWNCVSTLRAGREASVGSRRCEDGTKTAQTRDSFAASLRAWQPRRRHPGGRRSLSRS
jgi:hypothetical protein